MLLDELCPLLLSLAVLFYLLLLPFLEKKPTVIENIRTDYVFSISDVLDT